MTPHLPPNFDPRRESPPRLVRKFRVELAGISRASGNDVSFTIEITAPAESAARQNALTRGETYLVGPRIVRVERIEKGGQP